jgi:hypothetical protein
MIVIELSDEQATALKAKAAEAGLTLEAWLTRLAGAEPEPSTSRPLQSIADFFVESMKDVPPEDFDALPKDGLSQIDHYVYGVPKRTP